MDQALYRYERRLVGVLLLVMSLVVFLDVTHRVVSRSPGCLAMLAVSLLSHFGVALDAAWFDANLSPVLLIVALFGIAFATLRTRGMQGMRCLAWAAGIAAAMSLGLQLWLRFFPEGLVWAPYFALCTLLWVGLIGASMATYSGRHLALEMGEKLWPERWHPGVKRVSALLTASFAIFIAVLGAMSVADHYAAWAQSPRAALIPSVDLPKWCVFAVVPYAFAMIAWRSLGRALGLLAAPAPLEIGQ